MRTTFECDRCEHKIPVAYSRSHKSWHEAHPEVV